MTNLILIRYDMCIWIFVVVVCLLLRFGNHVNHYTKSGDIGALVQSRHMRSSRFDGMRVAAYKVECQQQVTHSYLCADTTRTVVLCKPPHVDSLV